MDLLRDPWTRGVANVLSVDGHRRCTHNQGRKRKRCCNSSGGLDLCMLHAHRAAAEPRLTTTLMCLKHGCSGSQKFYTVLRQMQLWQQRDFLGACLWF